MQKYVTFHSGYPHARLKLSGYYIHRFITSRHLRRAATRLVIAGLRLRYGAPLQVAASAPALQMLQDGVLDLGQVLSEQQCAEMLAYLRPQHMIAARGNGVSFDLDHVPPGSRFGDYPLASIVNCPHVMMLANRPELLALARTYLGYTPTISLLGLRWSFPLAGADADVQHFHRDSEPASIKILVYLTDVDEASGPHSYVPGSQLDRMPLRLPRYADEELERTHGRARVITGPAGSALAMDGRGIHKGIAPTRRARLMLAIQYALLPCLLFEYEPVLYDGTQPFDRYVNRLMLMAASAPPRA